MFCVLHLAEFALQAVLRTEPESSGRPAALFTEQTRKSVVLEANALAREYEIRAGMTAPQAVARCPTLLIRTPQPAAEAEARAALLAVAFTLSPTIEDTAPGLCTIDLSASDPARFEQSARAAVIQLRTLGLTATAGIGATPVLALYAARASTDDVLCVTNARTFLHPLPLEAADPAPGVRDILATWGLRTLGQLTALPRDDVGRRLGPDGLVLWDRAQGGETRPLRTVVPAQTFAATLDFEEEIETLEPLLFILRRFLERLALDLRTSGHVAAAMDLSLRLSDEATHQRSFRVPDPTADVEILFRALQTHLDALRTAAAIVSVTLVLQPTRPLVRQQGLFDTGLRDPHGFSETLARVTALVGADRVGTPQPEDTHRPDAVTLQPPAPVIPPPSPPPLHPTLGLPLRRCRPPLPAQIELTDGRPSFLWTERFSGAVLNVRGPWLSSGDWWQASRTWRRIEYDIALDTGGLLRLVRSDDRWWIEGEYD